MKTKFLILMPVYNAEKYLYITLKSIDSLEQNYFNICFINDGSTDSSEKILKEYCAMHCNAQLLSISHKGVSAARNQGLKVIGNEDYVLFLDADDQFMPEIFSVLEGCIQYELADIIVFGAHIINYDKLFTLPDIVPRNIIYNKFKPSALFDEVGSRPFVWNCAYKVDFLRENEFKFNENIVLGEDQLFQFTAFPKASKIQFISNKLYHYNYLKYDSAIKVHLEDNLYRVIQHINLVDEVITVLDKYGEYDIMQRQTLNWIYDLLIIDINKLKMRQFNNASRMFKDVLKKHNINIFKTSLSIKQKIKYLSLLHYPIHEVFRLKNEWYRMKLTN